MNCQDTHQDIIDREHLRLLSWGYLFSAILSALFSLLGLFYAAMGVMMGTLFSALPESGSGTGQAPPAFVGWFFGLFGGIFFLAMVILALLKFRVWKCLQKHKSRTFCLIVAGISCLGIPYGTLLGVCTLMVLGRPGVERLFSQTGGGEHHC